MKYRRARPEEWGTLAMCNHCGHVADDNDWDVMGLDEGFMQCLACGEIDMPIQVVEVKEAESMPLFDRDGGGGDGS
jgi:hypothetical protein